MVDPNEIFTMAGKSRDKHWQTVDYKRSGQLKRLESEHAELLKTFDGQLADVKNQLAQKKTISAERTYQCFFETYDELEENRKQQRLLLKPKYFEIFDSDTQRTLEEKSKVLRWVVEKVPFPRDIESLRTELSDCRKNTLGLYTMLKKGESFYREAAKV